MSDSKDRSRDARETSDPFAWWREWLVQSERQWNTALNELMGTDQFASSMGRWMELYLGVQKNLNETLGRALTGMNVPNRDDVAELDVAVIERMTAAVPAVGVTLHYNLARILARRLRGANDQLRLLSR